MAWMRHLPNAQYVGATSLVLLVHPTLDESFLSDCCIALEKVFDAATQMTTPGLEGSAPLKS
jgi:dTDP-4-amino-4,6-dideoxygalactose transaminase